MTDPERILEGLDPEQRQVAATPVGAMRVLAGAGTGKTRAITHRIAYGVHAGAFPAQQVLAVTFTARAAGEMRTRLRALGVPGVQARTFHAAALRQLQYFHPHVVGGAPPQIINSKAPLVAEAASRLRLEVDRTAVRDLAAEVEWAKVSLLTPATYAAEARRLERSAGGLDPSAMARLLEVYAEVASDRGVMDFEDVLLSMLAILRDRPDVARTVRSQYRHFVVDEYQDVNAVQQALLEAWTGERHDVCVVGDAAQTIYSFTGATPQHLLDFPTRHPGVTSVQLHRNYRSTPQVLGVANAVIAGDVRSAAGRVELHAQRPPGPEPELTVHADDEAEARWVAQRIGELTASGEVTPGDVAVLFRTNGQSEAVETALARAGVPYLVRGGERFFNRQEVRAGIVLLRGAVRSDDGELPLVRLTADVLSGAGWTHEPPQSSGAQRERWESLQALLTVAEDLAAAAPEARMADLVAELDRRAAEQHAPAMDGVTLASLHAAKGLEWPVVFIIGCSEGLMPISLARTPQAVDEERRLAYVGITRARDRLLLSRAKGRPGARSEREPSRFLAGAASVLGSEAVATRAPAEPGGGRSRRRARPAVCRQCGVPLENATQAKVGRCADCPPEYDVATFEALKAWRKAVALHTSKPAFTVFTDVTLEGIATADPGEVADLAGVSGIGRAKLERFGPSVMRVLGGEDPQAVADEVFGEEAAG
ncbi:ATP-dependent DNA helicase [Kytococcus schroeteri]|uniref:DNA 3'-5' helicase n=3 Tax=Kytococcus TaxID=57499 RepID=A0A2I1PDC2_9MICO|nr:ATP-dependent DNA helicase UvrD2 [Kytococcus schroeteri]PKZ42600.1 ATP-dependent DNA helicase [Kytococcus schroeteri]